MATKHVKAHTAANVERFRRLGEMGCIVCRLSHGAFVQSEVAHLTDAGRRTGHERTIPLCPWHHRAVPSGDIPPAQMLIIYGPSFAKSKKDFVAAFGTEESLLEATNRWLG
jgi:hypothetical protein